MLSLQKTESSVGFSESDKLSKPLIETTVCSPLPKRKTLNLKGYVQIKELKGPIATRSFNKLEEFIKANDSYPSSPFKTENKPVKSIKWDNQQDLQEYQSFSNMVKSDEFFNKTKYADIKQLRQQTKNPLGKEEFFPEKSFENLKFARDSLSVFEELERLAAPAQNQDIDDDLLIQKELELMDELSF